MNTQQIERALEHNLKTVKRFCGVFAADQLPKSLSTFPCGFVANTDPSTEPGTHWVVFNFTFPTQRLVNSLIVMGKSQNITVNPSKLILNLLSRNEM